MIRLGIIHSRNSGFTIIEIVIVLSLATMIGSMFLLVGMDSFRANAFHSDRYILISALERARAQSMNNICLGTNCVDGKKHGVRIDPDKYIIFQTDSDYDHRSMDDAAVDHILESSPLVAQGGLSEVVFAQVTGTTANTGDITLHDASGHSSNVSINSEGRITWTN